MRRYLLLNTNSHVGVNPLTFLIIDPHPLNENYFCSSHWKNSCHQIFFLASNILLNAFITFYMNVYVFFSSKIYKRRTKTSISPFYTKFYFTLRYNPYNVSVQWVWKYYSYNHESPLKLLFTLFYVLLYSIIISGVWPAPV